MSRSAVATDYMNKLTATEVIDLIDETTDEYNSPVSHKLKYLQNVNGLQLN